VICQYDLSVNALDPSLDLSRRLGGVAREHSIAAPLFSMSRRLRWTRLVVFGRLLVFVLSFV
jgi:hypothetical protein